MKEHLNRWCSVLVEGSNGVFFWNGELISYDAGILTLKDRSGKIKSIRDVDVRELTSEEVRA